VSRYDWLLFLHVLSAFALIASMVIFAVLLLNRDARDTPLLGISWLGSRLWEVGGLGTLVFGIWLAVDSPPPIDYDFFDGWIIAALLLWFVSGGTGSQLVAAYSAARTGDASALDTARFRVQNLVFLLAGTLLIADMIFKPGS
jgi:uncharacterized membrane protein